MQKFDLIQFIRARPPLSFLSALVLFVFGVLISDIPTMVVSPGWPTADGVIVFHRFVGQKFEEYDGDYFYNVDAYIRYEYVVDGITYASLSINAINTPFYPKAVADRYPVGTDVTVYYNPNDPSDAVLEPGFGDIFKALDIFSYFSFLLGAYFIHLAVSRIKQRRRGNKHEI